MLIRIGSRHILGSPGVQKFKPSGIMLWASSSLIFLVFRLSEVPFSSTRNCPLPRVWCVWGQMAGGHGGKQAANKPGHQGPKIQCTEIDWISTSSQRTTQAWHWETTLLRASENKMPRNELSRRVGAGTRKAPTFLKGSQVAWIRGDTVGVHGLEGPVLLGCRCSLTQQTGRGPYRNAGRLQAADISSLVVKLV